MKLFLILALGFSLTTFASGDHKEEGHTDDHEESVELPAGVVSFHDEEAEFTLRPNVVKNFEISSAKVQMTNGVLTLPESAVVRSLSKTTIFERKDNTFRSVPVKVIKTGSNEVVVQLQAKLEFDQIVSHGTNFLQTILLSLEEGPSEGHGH